MLCIRLVSYDHTYRYRGQTFPFVIQRLDPVQVGQTNLEEYCAGRRRFSRDQWLDALVRTMGYEPSRAAITPRVKLLYLTRMILLIEANYHMLELGPRQTGKSFCFTEFSPYGTLLAGGAVTVLKLFVTTAGCSQPDLKGRCAPAAGTGAPSNCIDRFQTDKAHTKH